MYKQDLALTNLQWLICHKIKLNKTKNVNINIQCTQFPKR